MATWKERQLLAAYAMPATTDAERAARLVALRKVFSQSPAGVTTDDLAAGLATKQDVNANLTAEAGLTGAADRVAYYTGAGAKALAGFTTFGRSLVAAADAAATKTLLSLSKADVGLGNVDNTSDLDKPVSTLTTVAITGKQDASANLTAEAGLVGSADKVSYYTGAGAKTLATFTAFGRSLVAAADAVATKTLLSLSKSDVGLGSVDNTADLDKPVSTATSAAITGKQDVNANLTAEAGLSGEADKVSYYTGAGAKALASFTTFGRSLAATVDAAAAKAALSLSKSDVGLGSVDNTADAAKNVLFAATAGSATPTAHAASHAAAGSDPLTLSKSDVGLGNVDNTSDVDKPVSTAQSTAIGARVLKTGDDMTGNLTLTKSTNAAIQVLISNTNAGTSTQASVGCTSDGGAFYFGAGPNAGVFAGGGFVYTSSAKPLTFWTANTKRMTLDGTTGVLTHHFGAQIGTSGTTLTQVKVYTQSLAPVLVAPNTSAEQTFTVSGLTTADTVYVNPPGSTAGSGLVGYRVSASDTLALTFANFTASNKTPPSGTYRIIAVRS